MMLRNAIFGCARAQNIPRVSRARACVRTRRARRFHTPAFVGLAFQRKAQSCQAFSESHFEPDIHKLRTGGGVEHHLSASAWMCFLWGYLVRPPGKAEANSNHVLVSSFTTLAAGPLADRRICSRFRFGRRSNSVSWRFREPTTPQQLGPAKARTPPPGFGFQVPKVLSRGARKGKKTWVEVPSSKTGLEKWPHLWYQGKCPLTIFMPKDDACLPQNKANRTASRFHPFPRPAEPPLTPRVCVCFAQPRSREALRAMIRYTKGAWQTPLGPIDSA